MADTPVSRESLPQRIHRRWRWLRRRITGRGGRPARVPVDRLLLGGENGISARQYAWLSGDLARPSRPVSDGPHARLLRDWQRFGDAILQPPRFQETDYYKNAVQAIRICGFYFSAQSAEQVAEPAARYVAQFQGDNGNPKPAMAGQSTDPRIFVRRIRDSAFYEVEDGHHRVASSIVRGAQELPVWVRPGLAEPTPLQSLLREIAWIEGRREIYHPIDLPEIAETWQLVRRCTDRFSMMERVLDELEQKLQLRSYIDLGSYFGWFLSKMGQRGYEAYGVERDPLAAIVGQAAYGVPRSSVWAGDLVAYYRGAPPTYDVTSCLSVLHHFALGRAVTSAEELIRMIDRTTRHVLFFDTGEGHEQWFAHQLGQWNPDFIQKWVLSNTTFKRVVPLGKDTDARPPYEQNYGRTLFACFRD